MSLKKIWRSSMFAALLAVGATTLVACSDEDGDGAVTDEEIGELREDAEELGEDISEEIDEGAEELEE